MRILFLIAMLAVVGLVGWLWFESDSQPQRTVPVSYTHLTLPTICSV